MYLGIDLGTSEGKALVPSLLHISQPTRQGEKSYFRFFF